MMAFLGVRFPQLRREDKQLGIESPPLSLSFSLLTTYMRRTRLGGLSEYLLGGKKPGFIRFLVPDFIVTRTGTLSRWQSRELLFNPAR